LFKNMKYSVTLRVLSVKIYIKNPIKRIIADLEVSFPGFSSADYNSISTGEQI
jgi:hypothetical protein